MLAALLAGAVVDAAEVSPELDPHAASEAHAASATRATLNLVDFTLNRPSTFLLAAILTELSFGNLGRT
ncbi:hypothetical protein [Nonomuraea sp. NPDC049784]|uniref:hypothetical protein n=1 Tax=Nonomuraea sp. NPDC049784 TaxID=3154361 RepID=UPI00340B09E3